jgi:parallel beta-helix repeat protein
MRNTALAVQLTGIYTINPGATATTTNFQNIRSAVTYMTSTAARADGGPANTGTVGVSGPVVFVISPGTYNEQVNIPAITGSSVTNNIVFLGSGRTSTILTFASADASNRHTLRLNLATNVTFRDMTIRATGSTVGWAVHVMGLNSNNNKFKNCLIEITGTGATSSSTNYIAVVLNNSATAATTGTRIDGTEIDSCTINAGYYSIVAAGASSNLHVGLRITNNQMYNGYLYGVYATFVNGITLHNNLIFTRASYLYNSGFYMINSICTAPNRHIITNNRIHGSGNYGIYISGSSNLSGNKGMILNNFIGGFHKYEYGMAAYFVNTNQWAMAHNTFYYDIAGYSATYGAVYFSGGSGISFRNNICAAKVASPSLPIYATSIGAFDTMNFNLFYRPDTSSGVLVYIGSNLNSGNFKGAGGHNNNSIYGAITFPNDTTLINNNPCYQGTPITYVPQDYFGVTRSTTNPTMGANEASAIGNDIAVLNVTAPTPPITAGLTDLSVLVRNNGNNTITSFDLSYMQNGGTPVVFNWSGTLGACDTVTITFTGSQQPTLGAVNNFKIYSSNPNFSIDSNRTNDTITRSYFLPMSGTYQIGGSSPDFAKPSDAFDAIRTAGLAGPVRLELNPGLYLDQITFDAPVIGLSNINNIVFAGKNRDSCIIRTNNASGSARHVIRIGQSHIRIDSMTLQANTSTAGWVVHINKNNTRNVHVKRCRIEVTHPDALISSSDVYAGVVMSGSNTSMYYYDTYVLDSIEIDSNIINGGYAGIWQYSYFYNYYYTYGAPSERLYFRNNTINNVYYTGIYTQGTRSLNINNNTIRFRLVPSETVYNYGIYTNNHDGSTNSSYQYKVNGNRVINSNYMAYYLYNCKTHADNRGEFNNNVGHTGFNLANAYGLYMYNQTNTDMYHNTIINTMPATNTSQGALYFGYNTGMRMRNNHFINTNPTTLAAPAYIVGSTFTSANQFNYNNFYRADTGANFVYINSWYSGTAFKGVGGSNINSTVVNPGFASDTLPIPSSGCYNGDTLSAVTIDILDSARATLPDIGAYEVPSPANDLSVTKLLAPTFPILTGTQDVYIQFINNGNNTVTSADIGFRFNGGTPVVIPWGGTLVPCDTTSTLFSGSNQINILPSSVNTLKAFTSNPNALTDGNTLNDTLNVIVATPMKGIYTIGSAPSDFTTLNAAKDALNLRGVDSIVIFRIKSGIYNEQVTFSAIPGASETNTITFTSLANHVDSVTISRTNVGTGDNFIIALQGTQYVTFEKVTLQSLSSSFGRVVQLIGNASYNNFYDCKFITPVVTTTSTNNTIVFANPLTGHFNKFKRNTFTGGSEAFNIFGTSISVLTNGNEIDSNTLTNQYARGFYMYYSANTKFRYNNVSTTSAYTVYYGLLMYYADSALDISYNRIFTTTAQGYGISTFYADGFGSKTGRVINNIIRVGTGSTSTTRGLQDQYSSNMLIAHNTVVVNGTSATASYAGYFYYTGTISNTTRIRNNIFMNMNSGNVYYNYNPTFGSSDNNLIWGTGATIMQRGTPANTYGSLQLFRAAITNQERNSLQYRPGINTTTLAPVASDTAVWALNGRAQFLPEITDDYAGALRAATTQAGVRDIGAYEVLPTSVPPLCVASPATPVAGSTQVFTFGSDTVCRILHDAFTTAPTFVAVRQYTGTKPPFADTSNYSLNMYIATNAPAGFYNGTLTLHYKQDWIGNIPSEFDMKLAQKTPGFSWSAYSSFASTTDSLQNTITAPFIFDYTGILFTGTDDLAPLPVELLSFEGAKSDDNAILNWSTSSEVNTRQFVVERSIDGVKYTDAGKVNAAGNSSVRINYLYEDKQAFTAANTLYYRLRIEDNDGTYNLSNSIRISGEKVTASVNVSPNPFRNSFMVSNLKANDKIEVMDINGRTVTTTSVSTDGDQTITLPQAAKPGIYFVKVSGSVNTVTKMVKE